MRRPRPRVLLPVLALACALVGGAVPAMAKAPATWHVGPDGPSSVRQGAGSCARPNARSIQAAVDASGRNDTIIVCDGVYRESTLISGQEHAGLTVKGATPWGATIVPSDGPGDPWLLSIGVVDSVTVQHLRFTADAACRPDLEAAILVSGSSNADVRANRIIGGNVTQGCGFDRGIFLINASGWIRYNLVQDWSEVGIVVLILDLGNAFANVTDNSLRFRSADRPDGDDGTNRGGVGVVNLEPTARALVARNVVSVAPAVRGTAADPAVGVGIVVNPEHGAVRDNRVTGAQDALVALGSGVRVVGNFARGLRRDCVGEAGQIWRQNNGRAWKSDPQGRCRLPD